MAEPNTNQDGKIIETPETNSSASDPCQRLFANSIFSPWDVDRENRSNVGGCDISCISGPMYVYAGRPIDKSGLSGCEFD